jgi:putative pyridoxal-dependent aspartate 1-decarboxylase
MTEELSESVWPDGALDLDGLLRGRGSWERRIERALDALGSAPRPCPDGAACGFDGFTDTRVPESGLGIDSYVQQVLHGLVSGGASNGSPSALGNMTASVPYFLGCLAKLVALMNQNVVRFESSRALTLCERQTLAMLHRLAFDRSCEFYAQTMQEPLATLGVLTSGGTTSNLVGLWCARNARLGAELPAGGVGLAGVTRAQLASDARDVVVLGSPLAHYSFPKALDILGLGKRNFVCLPVDGHDRIEIGGLRETLARCRAARRLVLAVIGMAGTTDAGSIDPLDAMADVCAEEGVHFHVDAAWGGPLLCSDRYRHMLRGLERADSVAMDGHKQFMLPIGLGVVLFRDPWLGRHIEQQASYLFREDSIDLGRISLDGSRPGSALLFHAALHVLGLRGYGALIERNMRNTQHLVQALDARPDFERLHDPQANIVLYRYAPPHVGSERVLNDINDRLQRIQFQRGYSFVSRSVLRHRTAEPMVALRAVLGNPNTTPAAIDRVLDEQAAIGREVACAVLQEAKPR